MWLYSQTWYPKWYPKKVFSVILNSELSSHVSAMCIVILDQKLHTCEHWWFSLSYSRSRSQGYPAREYFWRLKQNMWWQDSHVRYGVWRLWFQLLQHKFFGTTMVLILSLNSSNSFQFLNKKYINKAYKCEFTAKRGTPNGTQKKGFAKIVNSELSSGVSAMCIVILDQKLHTCQYSWFFDISLNLQKYHFFVWN